MVDALDLGSSSFTEWGFESPLSHQISPEPGHPEIWNGLGPELLNENENETLAEDIE